MAHYDYKVVPAPKRAKEILLTGNDRLSAREAHAMGLVNRVVPRAELEVEALRGCSGR